MPAYTHHGRVAFHETDAAGIVHFSNYFRYAEEAETAALASLGIFSAEALKQFAFPRVQASAQYHHPLHFHELCTVSACLTRIGNSSLTWRFEIAGESAPSATIELTSVRLCTKTQAPAPYTETEKTRLRTLTHQVSPEVSAPQK